MQNVQKKTNIWNFKNTEFWTFEKFLDLQTWNFIKNSILFEI